MKLKRFEFFAVLSGILLTSAILSRTNVVETSSVSAVENSTSASRAEKTSPKPPASSSDLAKAIEQRIETSGFKSARVGISVISLADGTTFYTRDSDRLFTPASNMKIYTTAVALDLLGADYRWRTSVYAKALPDTSGTVNGDLVLYGRGAPDLVSRSKKDGDPSLAKLVEDLYARGVRRIKGNVVGDESYFRGSPLGDGWQWTDLQWYFGAEASALSINENQIDVNVSPGAGGPAPTIQTSDPAGYVTVQNRMAMTNQSRRPTIGINRGLSDNNIAVWGEFVSGSQGFGARLAVHNPALWSASLFRDGLKARGIAVDGQVLARDSRVAPSERFDSSQFVELTSVSSQPLSEIARITNKESNNLFAELILRTLGRERGAMLEIPEPPGRERGDDEAGVALVRLWLNRANVPTNGLAIHDGSGLSRLDLVTPDSTARLLLAASKIGSAEVFKQSLPIAGKDGTLTGRLKSVGERVIAKTGSLTYDNSLSGYLTMSDGRQFAFSILSNDHTGSGSAIKLIDEITSLLASFPNLPAGQPEKPQ